MTETVFKETFRMSRESFLLLCKFLRGMARTDSSFRKCIPLEKRVAIALYALKSSAEYLAISQLFGVGKSTVCSILMDSCDGVWKEMAPTYLSSDFATTENIQKCIHGFEQYGLPQCFGAIDGCHIEVHPPKSEAVDYFNYKGWYSTVLLALVDHRYRFTYINVGAPGRCNDSSLFEKSNLFRILQDGRLKQNSSLINGKLIPAFIIGDSAFKLSEFLMKPYPFSTEASPSEKWFNYCLSKCRRVVENAFGHLKARFRRIGKGVDNNIANVKKVVKAACVLHNFLIDRNDKIYEIWLEKQDEIEKANKKQQPSITCYDFDIEGREMRNLLADCLIKKQH
ncbi:uncharacterized protein LOC142234515 [Haematobia irritans]|uniref:uncharacterized protein LOC142234515 n=1 Tax=Haematobia irritans TaxID=7368 RepID=UPI003F50B124